jgi:hypothetical protein
LAAAAIEGEHQLGPQPLAERMLADEWLDEVNDVAVATARQLDVHERFDRGQADVVQSSDGRNGELLVDEVGERRAPPQGVSRSQQPSAPDKVTLRHRAATVTNELLEAVEVNGCGGELEGIAGAAALHEIASAEHAP